MIIAQISDTHAKAANIRLFGTIDVVGAFRGLVARLEAMDPKPDVVIHTGDITNDGEASDYHAALDCLSGLSMPVYVTLGNHDLRDEARRAFANYKGIPASGHFSYVIEDHPVRIIMLDTLVEGEPHGVVGSEQLHWLNETLSAEPAKPTLVCLHHPPFDTGLGFMDSIGLHDASELENIISAHGQVERVLAGHVHRAFTAGFGGTIAMTCPAPAHQVAFSFNEEQLTDQWSADPPGFLLHRWSDGKLVSLDLTVEVSEGQPFSDDHLILDE